MCLLNICTVCYIERQETVRYSMHSVYSMSRLYSVEVYYSQYEQYEQYIQYVQYMHSLYVCTYVLCIQCPVLST